MVLFRCRAWAQRACATPLLCYPPLARVRGNALRVFQRLTAALLLCSAAPATAEWHEARSKHFIIYADMSPAQLRGYATRLERFDQAVRRVRGMSDPELTDARRLRVYTMPSVGAVSKLIGSKSAAGMYQSNLSSPAIFIPEVSGPQWSGSLDVPEHLLPRICASSAIAGRIGSHSSLAA